MRSTATPGFPWGVPGSPPAGRLHLSGLRPGRLPLGGVLGPGQRLQGDGDGARHRHQTVSSNVNPSAVGEPVTFTATVSPAAATGTVTFRDGGATSVPPPSPVGSPPAAPVPSRPATTASPPSIPATTTTRGSTSAPLIQTVYVPVPPPTLTTPLIESVGAGMATLVLQSGGTGTGYFTLLTGSGAACGTGAQVKSGLDSSGGPAPYHGSLPLTAGTPGRYTVRNLMQSTAYTVCFTADSPSGQNLNPVPATATFTTTASSIQPVLGGRGDPGSPPVRRFHLAGLRPGRDPLRGVPGGRPTATSDGDEIQRQCLGKLWGAPGSLPVSRPRWPSPRTGLPTWRTRTEPTAGR